MMIGNFLFNIFCVLWTLLYGIVGLPLLFFRSPQLLISYGKVWLYTILQGLRLFCGITYEVRGLEHLSSSKRMLLMAKHHSAFETLLLGYLIKRPTFILKKELTFVPIVGLYLFFTKMITIDRASYAFSFRKMLRQARERIESGRNIIIFPEGGRVDVNEDVEYQRGVSALYSDPTLQDVEFIPVALNCGLFWPYGIFDKKTPGKAIIQFLPPIKKSLSKNEFMKTIKAVIDSASNKLVEESCAESHQHEDSEMEQLKQ